MQYSINLIPHFVEALVLYHFHIFSGEKKAREHRCNQTIHMWIFTFLIYPRSSKVLWYQLPFQVFWEFWNIKHPHLTSTTKHKNTAKKSLFILTEFTLYYWSLKVTKYNFFTFTFHTCPQWHADFASDLFQFISHWETTQIWWLWGRHEQTKFREFIYEKIFA